MVVHAFNPSTQEVDLCEFEDSQDYTKKPYLEKTNKKNRNHIRSQLIIRRQRQVEFSKLEASLIYRLARV